MREERDLVTAQEATEIKNSEGTPMRTRRLCSSLRRAASTMQESFGFLTRANSVLTTQKVSIPSYVQELLDAAMKRMHGFLCEYQLRQRCEECGRELELEPEDTGPTIYQGMTGRIPGLPTLRQHNHEKRLAGVTCCECGTEMIYEEGSSRNEGERKDWMPPWPKAVQRAILVRCTQCHLFAWKVYH